MRNNAYKTNDPEVLLRLKRQEADALRDILRSINRQDLGEEQIFKIAKNTLLAQCGVKKMKYIYRTDEGFVTAFALGFGKFEREVLQELPDRLRITKVDEASHPELFAQGVEYVVPVNFKNSVGAWFLVANFAETEAEVDNDLIFIETIGNVVSAAIENRSLIREMVQQESLKRELEVAERIQSQLLITDFNVVQGASIYGENFAHHKIGGDYYDVVPRGEKGFFLCIADVAGKGIGAALLMANLQANLRALILSENDLRELIHKLHRSINVVTRGEQFVTFFIAHVRTEDGEMDYINAGHNPPALLRNGEISLLDKGTIPLGIMDLPYVEEETIKIQSEDLLFMYTDGLVEQTNARDEMLSEEPVYQILKKLAHATPREIVERINALYHEFSKGAIQDDDVTTMAVRFE